MSRTHADDAAVHIKGEGKASSSQGNSPETVQFKSDISAEINPVNSRSAGIVLDALDVARFWSKVDVKGAYDCWLWKEWLNRQGYAEFKLPGGSHSAHRVAYTAAYGAIPEGAVIRHTCDTPACVNPQHLITGTHADNVRDRVLRKRSAKGEAAGRARLTEADVIRIRTTPRNFWPAIAKELGVSESTVSMAGIGLSWTHLECPPVERILIRSRR